jgi:hypothetical protein
LFCKVAALPQAALMLSFLKTKMEVIMLEEIKKGLLSGLGAVFLQRKR